MIAAWYGIVSFMLIVYVGWTGAILAPECCTGLSPGRRRNGGRWSRRSGRFGHGMKCGWSVSAARWWQYFRVSWPSAFSGYYLALFLILWCLILRGIALEVGGHINDRLWQGFWDFVFVVLQSSPGRPFRRGGRQRGAGRAGRCPRQFLHGHFSPTFGVRGYVGLLDWYTVSIAIFAAVILAAHGATYLTSEDGRPGA